MRVLLATTALALAVATGCSGGDTGPSAAPSRDSTPDASGETVPDGVEVTRLDTGAVGVADVAGTAWTALPEDGSVRNAGDRRTPVGEAPLRLVDTPAGVWVSVIGDGTVVRLDPRTGKVTRRVPLRPAGSEPEGLASDGESVWVVDQAHGRVLRLRPDGTLLGSVRVGAEPRLATAGPSGLWVANYGGGSVSLVPRSSGGPLRARTVEVPGCRTPQGVAEAAGTLWISCTSSSVVVGLDVRTLQPRVTLDDLTGADAVVADATHVYVVGQAGPTVWTIDPQDGRVTARTPLDDGPLTRENVGAAVVGEDLV